MRKFRKNRYIGTIIDELNFYRAKYPELPIHKAFRFALVDEDLTPAAYVYIQHSIQTNTDEEIEPLINYLFYEKNKRDQLITWYLLQKL